jgi:hypothetical protein
MELRPGPKAVVRRMSGSRRRFGDEEVGESILPSEGGGGG